MKALKLSGEWKLFFFYMVINAPFQTLSIITWSKVDWTPLQMGDLMSNGKWEWEEYKTTEKERKVYT